MKRTLIVTPANLTFQWQRELRDKFREQFEIVRPADAFVDPTLEPRLNQIFVTLLASRRKC